MPKLECSPKVNRKKSAPEPVSKIHAIEKKRQRINEGYEKSTGGFIRIDKNFMGSEILIKMDGPYTSKRRNIIDKNLIFKCYHCDTEEEEYFNEYKQETILLYSTNYEKTKSAICEKGVFFKVGSY